LYELFRLKASYETEAEMRVRHKTQEEMGLPIVRCDRHKRLHEFIEDLTTCTMGWSVPVEWGFAAVLSKMTAGTKANLILMSDNLDDEGDVHVGPFGTKHFVQWLKTMDVGEIHDTPARESHRGKKPRLQVWIWHPDWEKVETLNRQGMLLALKYYKEIKNVEKELEAKQRNANSELLATFSRAAGWE
jgi:hypothetical protein